MNMRKYDVTIIGAGPSGCVTAILCAKAGLDTILIEQKSLPRNKVCGGGLTMKSIEVLRNLNCFDECVIERFCNSVQIHLPRLGEKLLVKSDKPLMAIIKRATFDNSLAYYAKEAGVELREKEQFIESKVHHSGYVEVFTNHGAILTDILIGADGVLSKVRKQLQSEYPQLFPKRDLLVGVSADVPIEISDCLSSQYAHLFFDFANGIDYGWVFPKKETFNIGFGYKPKKGIPINVRDSLTFFIHEILGRQYSQLKVRVGALPIFWSGTAPTVQWGHVMLVGDAAGFVDEWTGEGLYYSIKSAVHASKSIDLYFHGSREDRVLLRYTNLCSKDFYNDLLFSHFIARLFRTHPHRYNYLRDSNLRNLFIPFAKGHLSYRHAVIKALPHVLYRKVAKICNECVQTLSKKRQ
jgi:geranylgeranyl reductase family protein